MSKPDSQTTKWLDLETMPTEEGSVFLVRWENDLNCFIALQVSWFEGHLYPDHKGGNIDHSDIVEGYTHWCEAPEILK